MKKMIVILLKVLLVLGLVACSSPADDYQSTQPKQSESTLDELDLSFFADFPEWWLEVITEEDQLMFLHYLSTDDLKAMREQIMNFDFGNELPDGVQQIIVAPGGDGLVISGNPEDEDIPTD